MKVEIDKRGFLAICTVFTLCTYGHHLSLRNNDWIYIIFYTMGVWFSYFGYVIIAFLFHFFKNKTIFIYSDWRVILIMLFYNELILSLEFLQ